MSRAVLFLLLLLSGCFSPPRPSGPEGEATGIAGRVVDRAGAPAAGAQVYAYRTPRGGLKGPADFAASVGEDGRYFLDLVEGEYYLVARQRRQGGEAGPPRAGDAWSLHPANPVKVEAGRTTEIDFRLQAVTRPALMKEGTLPGGDTGFTGRLVDERGRGVAGAFMLGYRDRDFHRMPDAAAPAADEEGRFILHVPAPGRWCLAARGGYRGQPRAGEPYGTMGEGEKACRSVEKGEMIDVGEIVLRPYRR